jgi:hypothetical protein
MKSKTPIKPVPMMINYCQLAIVYFKLATTEEARLEAIRMGYRKCKRDTMLGALKRSSDPKRSEYRRPTLGKFTLNMVPVRASELLAIMEEG